MAGRYVWPGHKGWGRWKGWWGVRQSGEGSTGSRDEAEGGIGILL